ncbi:MAG: SDR family oxidoreductase [Burkholderiales bacterium]
MARQPVPRAVFITGASSGIGAALARHYNRQGATVGLVARRRDVLEALARELDKPIVLTADVRNGEAMTNAARYFIAQAGVPDLVIANAGVSVGMVTGGKPEDISVFQEVMDINVLGAVHTFQPFVAAMRDRGHGTLVGIASVAGFRGLPGSGAYSASKAALISYLESLRVELHGSGVQVSTICPGYIATPMTAHNPYAMPFILEADEFVARMARAVAAGRRFAVIPWPMAIVGSVLRVLPDWLYDRLFAGAPRKPGRN